MLIGEGGRLGALGYSSGGEGERQRVVEYRSIGERGGSGVLEHVLEGERESLGIFKAGGQLGVLVYSTVSESRRL